MKRTDTGNCVKCQRKRILYQFNLCFECLEPSLGRSRDLINSIRNESYLDSRKVSFSVLNHTL